METAITSSTAAAAVTTATGNNVPSSILKASASIGPGYIFNERWRLRNIIGKGAFSEIFIAEDIQNNNENVAIKIQNESFDVGIMKWEANVLKKLLNYSNFPNFYSIGSQDARHYLVMELLRGENMGLIRDRARKESSNGLIPLPVACYFTLQALSNIKALHQQGFVHRDVKPTNFVRRNKNQTEFCLIDFGLTKEHYDVNRLIVKERDNASFRGTTIYASPYAHLGYDQCFRDDLFSITHMFMDLIFGELPWREAAKAKDRDTVREMKGQMLKDPTHFFYNVIIPYAKNRRGHIDSSRYEIHSACLDSIANRVGHLCIELITYLKELKYIDNPDYDRIQSIIKKSVDEEDIQAVSNINYNRDGFKWKNTPNDSSVSMIEANTLTTTTIQQLREKIQVANTKMQSLVRDSAQNKQNDTFGRSAYERTAAGAEYIQANIANRNLSLAVRWKNIVNSLLQVRSELLKYRNTTDNIVPKDLLQQVRTVLEENFNFFDCQLGQDDLHWSQFVAIQRTASQFYAALKNGFESPVVAKTSSSTTVRQSTSKDEKAALVSDEGNMRSSLSAPPFTETMASCGDVLTPYAAREGANSAHAMEESSDEVDEPLQAVTENISSPAAKIDSQPNPITNGNDEPATKKQRVD